MRILKLIFDDVKLIIDKMKWNNFTYTRIICLQSDSLKHIICRIHLVICFVNKILVIKFLSFIDWLLTETVADA